MWVLERTQGPQVEDGAQVDVEPCASLPRERLHTIPEILHRGTRQGCVVRGGPRSNPNRGTRQIRPEALALAFIPVALDPVDRIRLADVPLRVRERRGMPRLVQDRAGVV